MNPAFAYIYDESLGDRRYERELARVETELARRGIEGRIVRLTLLRQPRDVILDLARGLLKNIIFVGNDQTLQRNIWFLPETSLTIGFLPMMPSPLATLLDIPVGQEAVDVLAARFIDCLDVGRVNDRYFLTEVVVPEARAVLELDQGFRASPLHGGAMAIRNLAGATVHGGPCAHPADGWLEGVIQAKIPSENFWKRSALSESRIYFRDGRVSSSSKLSIFVDGEAMQGTIFSFSLSPKKLRFITGRRRAWATETQSSERVT